MHTNSFTPGTLLRALKDGHMVGGLLVVTAQGLLERSTGKPSNGLDVTTLVKVGDAPEYADGVRALRDPLADGV